MRRITIYPTLVTLAALLVAGVAVAGDCKAINGTWHYYGPTGNSVTVDQPPGVPNYSGMAAGWALDVLSANDGEVWAQNAYVYHYDTWSLAEDFVYSSTSYITGGTGKYESATGWFGFVGSEAKGGIIHGEICVP